MNSVSVSHLKTLLEFGCAYHAELYLLTLKKDMTSINVKQQK